MPGTWYSLVARTVSSMCKFIHTEAGDTGSQVSHSVGVCGSHRDITQRWIKQDKMCSGLISMLLLWVCSP